jgi:hypothetical protein
MSTTPDPTTNTNSRIRIAEVAEILVLGLQRLRAVKSSTLSAETGESSLHFSPAESGHGSKVLTPEKRS